MSIIIRFFPNGEFSQGVDTSQRRDKRDHAKQRNHSPLDQECRDGYLQWVSEGDNADIHLCVPGTQFRCRDNGIYTYLCKDSAGHHYAYECEHYVLPDVLMNEPVGQMIGRGELVPLVYQTVESSAPPQKPSRKRLQNMTRNMARNIRNAAYLLESKYGKDNLSFVTLTLPTLSTDDLAKLSDQWDELVDNFLHTIRKRVKNKSGKFEYVYCTEIQLKRLQQRNEYAPHLHIVMLGRNGKKTPWFVSPRQFRSAWGNAIANILGHNSFVRSALENVQRVKHSAAGYLSKYLSKGVRCNAKVELEGYVQLRTQWGGMARELSRLIKTSTRLIRDDGAERQFVISFLRCMDELLQDGIVKFWRQGFVLLSVCPISGVERGFKVGCGCLSVPTVQGGLDKLRDAVLRIDRA